MKNIIKKILNNLTCFILDHLWTDIIYAENAACHGSTLRHCRRCKRKEHKQIQGKYTCIGEWRKV